MLIREFIGADCMIAKQEVLVGKVLEVVVDPNRPKLVALIVGRDKKKNNWKILKIVNVIDGWNGLVWIKSRDSLFTFKQAKIVADIFEQGYLVIGRWALNKDLQRIGKIVDFDFDLLTGAINNFHLEKGVGWWKQKRIIGARMFIEVIQKGVVFDINGSADLRLQKIQEVELVIQ